MSTENGRCYRICKTCGNREWQKKNKTQGGQHEKLQHIRKPRP